jgi:hypothetical protein
VLVDLPAGEPAPSSTAKRWPLAVLDQAVYSSSNVVLTLSISAVAGIRSLGVVAVVLVFLHFVQRMLAAVLGDVALLLAGSGIEPHRPLLRWTGAAIPPTAAVGFAVALVAGLGWDDGGRSVAAAAVVGAIFATVIWQAAVRTLAIAHNRFGRALAADAAWTLVCVLAWVCVPSWASGSHERAFLLLSAWGAGCVLSACLLQLPARGARFTDDRGEYRLALRENAGSIAFETFLNTGVALVIVWLLALLATDEDVGAYRLAEAAFGVLPIVYSGVRPLLTRDLRRGLVASGSAWLRHQTYVASTALAVVGVVTSGAILLAARSRLGELANLDEIALAVLLLMALDRVAAGPAVVLQASVRAAGASRQAFGTRLASFVTGIGLAAVLVGGAAATGAAAALAASRIVVVVGYKRLVVRAGLHDTSQPGLRTDAP